MFKKTTPFLFVKKNSRKIMIFTACRPAAPASASALRNALFLIDMLKIID